MLRILPSFTAIMPADPCSCFAPSSVTRVIEGVGVFDVQVRTTTRSRAAAASRTHHPLDGSSAAA